MAEIHYLIIKDWKVMMRTTERETVRKVIANAKPEDYNTKLRIYASKSPIEKIVIEEQGKF
jgi:hypothetical protein